LRVTSRLKVAGRCGFILLQPHKIKMKNQSFSQFCKPTGFLLKEDPCLNRRRRH